MVAFISFIISSSALIALGCYAYNKQQYNNQMENDKWLGNRIIFS